MKDSKIVHMLYDFIYILENCYENHSTYFSLPDLKIENNVKKLKLNSYTKVNKSLQITAISDILSKSEPGGRVFSLKFLK